MCLQGNREYFQAVLRRDKRDILRVGNRNMSGNVLQETRKGAYKESERPEFKHREDGLLISCKTIHC